MLRFGRRDLVRAWRTSRAFTTVIDSAVLKPTSPVGTIGSLLDAQVVHNHLRNASHVVEQSFSQWTFGELKRHVDAFANGLLSMRFAPGDRLALALPNNAEMLVAMLGAAKVGVVVMPLSVAPSEALLRETLQTGVKGLIFTDVVGDVNYGDMLAELVPEVKDFRASIMYGMPFRSLTYPATQFLINTAKSRLGGMLRYQWVPIYSYDDNLKRSSKTLSASYPFLFDPISKKISTHGDILSKAESLFGKTKKFPSSHVIGVGAPLTTADAFVAGYAAAHLSGCLAVYSQENDVNSFDMFFKVVKPHVFVADEKALQAVAGLKAPQPVSQLVLVGPCKPESVEQAKKALEIGAVVAL